MYTYVYMYIINVFCADMCGQTLCRTFSHIDMCATIPSFMRMPHSYVSSTLSYTSPLSDMCDMTRSHMQMTHSYVSFKYFWRDSPLHIPFSDVCDMTRLYFRHDSFTFSTWLIHMCRSSISGETLPYIFSLSVICVTWFVDICDMTDLYVSFRYFWRDSPLHIPFKWYVRHDSFILATWLIHMYRLGISGETLPDASSLSHVCDMSRS